MEKLTIAGQRALEEARPKIRELVDEEGYGPVHLPEPPDDTTEEPAD